MHAYTYLHDTQYTDRYVQRDSIYICMHIPVLAHVCVCTDVYMYVRQPLGGVLDTWEALLGTERGYPEPFGLRDLLHKILHVAAAVGLQYSSGGCFPDQECIHRPSS